MVSNMKTNNAHPVRMMRVSKGLTQLQLAKAVGTTKTFVSKIENRSLNLSVEKAKILASYFDVSLDYILGHTEKQNDKQSLNIETLDFLWQHIRYIAHLGSDAKVVGLSMEVSSYVNELLIQRARAEALKDTLPPEVMENWLDTINKKLLSAPQNTATECKHILYSMERNK
jgi:transcriptional regulator with XRE-family HTH domain